MRRKPLSPNNQLALLLIGVFVLAAGAALLTQLQREKKPIKPAEPVASTIRNEPVIAYHGPQKDQGALTDKRKAKYGVDKGVDLIVRPNETVKIGDTTVSMQEILDRIHRQQGDIVEKNVGEAAGQRSGNDHVYGIYVVQPGDNIWNVHFQFLRDYFKRRGVTLSLVSDEPNRLGYSSGVGKILKFSEGMVHIYNIKENHVDTNLNLIYPLSKIVVFDMKQVSSLLDQIDVAHINHLKFDGETLWIPADQ
jgi:hypothetical protein